MIYVGWGWWVVYAEVDIQFPGFASVAQKALNTRNHIANVVGELEVCMTLASMMKDPGMTSQPEWKTLAADNIVSLCAPCAQYASILLKYIVAYGGSDDACLIQFVDDVAKQFSANVALGQSFWAALCDTEFADKSLKFPLVRTALMLANLTGGKVEDSVARLIGPSHVVKVASRTSMADAITAEMILQDAWGIVQATSSTEACIKPLGQIFSRLGLKVTNMEKRGREGICYSFSDLKKKFLEGVGEVVGKKIDFPKWIGDDDENMEADEAATKVAKAYDAPKMAKISDHYDPAFVSGLSGFSVGVMVVEKGIEVDPENVYAIFSIGDVGVVLHQACSFAGKPRKVSITVDELLKNWAVTKHETPVMMKQPVSGIPESFRVTLKRADIFGALMHAFTQHQKRYDDLVYFRGVGGDHIRTSDCTIKAGSLILVPAVPMVNIVADSTSANRGIDMGTYDDHKYTLMPTSKPATKCDAWDPCDAFVNPYFWIGKIVDRKLANMEADEVIVKGYTLSVLKNKVDLAPHTKLVCYVTPKAAVQPLRNAVKDDDSEDHADKAPKAKAKATAKATTTVVNAKAKSAAGKAPAAKKAITKKIRK